MRAQNHSFSRHGANHFFSRRASADSIFCSVSCNHLACSKISADRDKEYEALKRDFSALTDRQLAYLNMLNTAWQQNGYALANRGGKIELNWAQIVRVMATLTANTIVAHNVGSCYEWSGAIIPNSRRPYIAIQQT